MLSKYAKNFFNSIVEEHNITDTRRLETLDIAAINLDTMAACDKAIAKHGLLLVGVNGGMRQNPACLLRSTAYKTFLACMRDLEIDVPPASRDPTTWSQRQKRLWKQRQGQS